MDPGTPGESKKIRAAPDPRLGGQTSRQLESQVLTMPVKEVKTEVAAATVTAGQAKVTGRLGVELRERPIATATATSAAAATKTKIAAAPT